MVRTLVRQQVDFGSVTHQNLLVYELATALQRVLIWSVPHNKKNTHSGVVLLWWRHRDSLDTLCLRGNRNDFAVLRLQNLLVYELATALQRVLILTVPTKIKTTFRWF